MVIYDVEDVQIFFDDNLVLLNYNLEEFYFTKIIQQCDKYDQRGTERVTFPLWVVTLYSASQTGLEC